MGGEKRDFPGGKKSGKEGNKEEVAGRRRTRRRGMERERWRVAISSYNG